MMVFTEPLILFINVSQQLMGEFLSHQILIIIHSEQVQIDVAVFFLLDFDIDISIVLVAFINNVFDLFVAIMQYPS